MSYPKLPCSKMLVGSFEVPEARLSPHAISDIKKAYESMKTQTMSSTDLGGIWGYKSYSTGAFYRRLNTVLVYGLLQQVGKGTFRVTELGEGLAFPESDEKDRQLKQQAVLNVPLWNEIFKKHGKNISDENFWVQLRTITNIDPVEAKKIQNQIRKWYFEDMVHVSENALKDATGKQPQGLSSTTTNNNQMSQQLMSPQQAGDPSSQEIIQFGKTSLALPKKDLRKQWEKLQKYMEIYLEDYHDNSESQSMAESDDKSESEQTMPSEEL